MPSFKDGGVGTRPSFTAVCCRHWKSWSCHVPGTSAACSGLSYLGYIPTVSYPNLGGYTGYFYICSFYQLVMGLFSDCVFCCSLHLVTACLQADGSAFLARRTTYALFHTAPSCLLFLAVKELACWGREMSWKGCFNKTSGELGAD